MFLLEVRLFDVRAFYWHRVIFVEGGLITKDWALLPSNQANVGKLGWRGFQKNGKLRHSLATLEGE